MLYDFVQRIRDAQFNVARSYLSILSNLNAASKNVPPSYQAREYLGNIRNLNEKLVGIGDWVWITRNLAALYLKVKREHLSKTFMSILQFKKEF